jgi:hypothetical protein
LATPAGLPKTKNIKTVSSDEEPRRKAAKQMEEIVVLSAPSAAEQNAIKRAQENKAKRRPAAKLGLRPKGKSEAPSESQHSDEQGWPDDWR